MQTIKRRSIGTYIVLNIITCGIYGLIVNNSIGKDIDTICKGDGENEQSYLIAWVLGIFTGGLYTNYWWYKQMNRLKYNAGRYGLEVKESGTYFLFLTYLSIAFGGIGYWIALGYLFKVLNQYADCETEPYPFDPMGYEYYETQFCSAEDPGKDEEILRLKSEVKRLQKEMHDIESAPPKPQGNQGEIVGITGNNAGYRFNIKNGEEFIIGKDPSVASIVIDRKYKDVSRKHCSVLYVETINQYQVTDYSANGTYIDGKRMPVHGTMMAPANSELKLAASENIFKLG